MGSAGDHHLWYDRRFIEIIHNNWPFLLERFRLKGLEAKSEHNYSKAEMAQLINAGLTVNYIMEDGTVYFPPGGGISTANTSIEERSIVGQHARLILWGKDVLIRDLVSKLPFVSVWPIKLEFYRFGHRVDIIYFRDVANKIVYIVRSNEDSRVSMVSIPERFIGEEYVSGSLRLSVLVSSIRVKNSLYSV